jgi:hypothetical protein
VRPALLVVSIALVVIMLGLGAPASNAQQPGKFPNCKALNKRYPHGVGRVGARDKTASGDPVTNFKRSRRLYDLNKGLDRDKGRIACEKK